MKLLRNVFTCFVLMVVLVAFSAPAQDLARIAITDFENKAGADPAVCSALVDMMTTALAKSGKFALVERDAFRKLAEEQNFSQSGAVDSSSAARMGEVLGADYILIGAVTEVNAGESKGVRLGGLGLGSAKVSIASDVRVVDCTTSEVKMADTFREERGGTSVDLGNAGFSATEGTGGEMARVMIDAISIKVCAAVYPPTILQSDGTKIVVNYGEMMFAVGDVYDVFALGEPLKDPATGKVLGREETFTGTVTITRTDAKMTHADITTGEAVVGSVLRAQPEAAKPKKGLFGRKKK